MTLADAGKYIGPDVIEEYVKFATLASPFVLNGVEYAAKFGISGYSPSEGTCDFLIHSAATYELDPVLTVSLKINVLLSLKITYDAVRNMIPRINVY